MLFCNAMYLDNNLSFAGDFRSAKFGLMRNGNYTGVSVLLNTLTKFSKLQVGKYVVTAN